MPKSNISISDIAIKLQKMFPSGLTNRESEKYVKSIFLILKFHLLKNEPIILNNFGRFKIGKRKPTKLTGIDGKIRQCPAVRTINFKSSKRFKDELNKRGDFQVKKKKKKKKSKKGK